MKKKNWPLLALIGFLIVAGGVLFFNKVTLLQLANMDRGRTLHIRVEPSEPFSIYYIHSIYREPVLEEFRVGKGLLLLEGVRTKSFAVMEYYGFEDNKEFHPVTQKLGAIFLKWGTGDGQALIVRERKIYLSEVGERGDRIRLSVVSVPLGYYLLRHFNT